VPAGTALNDSATLSVEPLCRGTITFTLYGPVAPTRHMHD
jgi:hypothetical protein